MFRLLCGQRKIGPPVLERHASTQTQTLHFNVLVTIVETTLLNSRGGICIDHRNRVWKPPKGFNTCLYSELSLGNQKHSCHHTTSVKRKLDQTPAHPQFSVESALSAYPFNNRHFQSFEVSSSGVLTSHESHIQSPRVLAMIVRHGIEPLSIYLVTSL